MATDAPLFLPEPSMHTHPRVEQRLYQVDDEVRGDHQRGREDGHADDDRQVLVDDRLDHLATESG